MTDELKQHSLRLGALQRKQLARFIQLRHEDLPQ